MVSLCGEVVGIGHECFSLGRRTCHSQPGYNQSSPILCIIDSEDTS